MIKRNQERLDFLYELRDQELEALDELDEARALGDSVMQEKALEKLRRTMIDFALDTYLDFEGRSPTAKPTYTIDYSYHTEHKEGGMKSIHSEIEREKNKKPIQMSGGSLMR